VFAFSCWGLRNFRPAFLPQWRVPAPGTNFPHVEQSEFRCGNLGCFALYIPFLAGCCPLLCPPCHLGLRICFSWEAATFTRHSCGHLQSTRNLKASKQLVILWITTYSDHSDSMRSYKSIHFVKMFCKP
jgi:hypothetical protein